MVWDTIQRDETGTQRRFTLRHRQRLCGSAAGAGWRLATGSAQAALKRFGLVRKLTLPLCFGLLILLLARPAGASVMAFSDDTFTPSNWSLTTQTKGPGGDARVVQQSSGGDPGAYRQVTVDVVGSSDSEVYAFNLMSSATVTPASSGAIISLTYSEARDTTGQEFGPAIEQNGNLYYAYAGSGGTSGWQSTTMTFAPGAANNDLLTSFHTDADDSAHPDFSATGAPMTFGFAAIDNSNATSFTAVSGYDDWAISVTTNSNSVPEPGSLGVLGLTSLTLLRRPRRTE
jgi:hypothetical protein